MKSFYKNHKQIIDQTAHLIVGFLGMLSICSLTKSASIGLLISMLLVFGRELSQHNWRFADLGQGSLLDLIFWWLGFMAGGFLWNHLSII